METATAYQSYLTAMQNYQIPQGRKDYQAPFANQFEAIYNKAKEESVNLSNAKEFLQTLSQEEMKTLKNYSGLAETINIGAISAEGAFNLLLHDNEQYDFNNDGAAEVGKGKHMLPIPTNMPSDVRDAYISAMNSLKDEDKLMMMSLTFDSARLNSMINNEPYMPTTIDYNYLKTEVENRLNPKNGGYTSEEAKASTLAFWNAFNAAYTGDKTEANTKESDEGVASFLKKLREKGAAKFLADLNKEKIEALVQEYKQKLIDEMGDSPEALQDIAKLVEAFKKKLVEEMKEKMEDEKKNKKITSSNISTLAKATPLEKLLQL